MKKSFLLLKREGVYFDIARSCVEKKKVTYAQIGGREPSGCALAVGSQRCWGGEGESSVFSVATGCAWTVLCMLRYSSLLVSNCLKLVKKHMVEMLVKSHHVFVWSLILQQWQRSRHRKKLSAVQSFDNPAIRTADRTRQYFISMWPTALAEDQQERHTAPWSANAAEGATSEPQGDRDQAQEIREHRQQVQDITRVLEAVSFTHSQPRERDVLPGWSSDQWGSWKPTGGTTQMDLQRLDK